MSLPQGFPYPADDRDYYLPALATPITAGISGHVILYGFSIRETSGAAPALVTLGNAVGGGGFEMLGVQVNPGGSVREWFGPNGIDLPNGLNPNTAGAVLGSWYYGERWPT